RARGARNGRRGAHRTLPGDLRAPFQDRLPHARQGRADLAQGLRGRIVATPCKARLADGSNAPGVRWRVQTAWLASASPHRVEVPVNILTVNLLFTTVVFGIAARIYVVPRMAHVSSRAILTPILLLHAFRNLGLMFLSPGATYPGMPPGFATPSAYGDLLAAV